MSQHESTCQIYIPIHEVRITWYKKKNKENHKAFLLKNKLISNDETKKENKPKKMSTLINFLNIWSESLD
jgi:hypothetical protein